MQKMSEEKEEEMNPKFEKLVEEVSKQFDGSPSQPENLKQWCREKIILSYASNNPAAIEALICGEAAVVPLGVLEEARDCAEVGTTAHDLLCKLLSAGRLDKEGG